MNGDATFVSASGDRTRIYYVIDEKQQIQNTKVRILRGVGEAIWEATLDERSTRRAFLDHYPVAMRWRGGMLS